MELLAYFIARAYEDIYSSHLVPVWWCLFYFVLSTYIMHLVCECVSNESIVMPDDSFHYEVVRRYVCFSWHCVTVNLSYTSLIEMYMDRSVERLSVEVVVTDRME